VLFWARQYDRAIAQFGKVLDLSPDRAVVVGMLGTAYLQKSMYAPAIAQWERSTSLAGRTTSVVAQLGYTYAVAGRKADAQHILAELTDRSKREYVAAYWIAMVHHGLGQEGEALKWLEKAFQDREALVILNVEPRWDGLRSNPAFQSLQRRVGFSAASPR
jgi:serine/threonine-protein kinase